MLTLSILLLCFHSFNVQEVFLYTQYTSRYRFVRCSQKSPFLHTCPVSSILTTSLPFVDASNPKINLHIQLWSFFLWKARLLLLLPHLTLTFLVKIQSRWVYLFDELQQFWTFLVHGHSCETALSCQQTELLLTPLLKSCLLCIPSGRTFVLNLCAWGSMGNRRLSSMIGTQQRSSSPLQWSFYLFSEAKAAVQGTCRGWLNIAYVNLLPGRKQPQFRSFLLLIRHVYSNSLMVGRARLLCQLTAPKQILARKSFSRLNLLLGPAQQYLSKVGMKTEVAYEFWGVQLGYPAATRLTEAQLNLN